jgi:hypothetical protein
MDHKKNQKTKLQKIGSMPVRAKAEVNLLTLPYFCLDKYANSHRQIEVREIQQRDNEIFEKIWTVRPGQDFRLPSDFERRLQRTVEYSISSLPRPITNPVPLPGFRKLALLMGVACTGKFVKRVKDGFLTMIKTEIRSRRSYYNKLTTSWIDNDFSLYKKIVFKGEKLPDGKKADRNYAYLSSEYLSNLNSMYVRPIDFEYLKSLKPIASRLYELLGVKFYGHNDFIQYKYSTLCSLLPISRQKTLSRARQQLEAAHQELNGPDLSNTLSGLPKTKARTTGISDMCRESDFSMKSNHCSKHMPWIIFLFHLPGFAQQLMNQALFQPTMLVNSAITLKFLV